MATLSKEVLNSIAKKMTEKSKQHADKLKKEYQTLAKHLYLDTVPDDVMNVFKKFPDYVETALQIYINQHGFNGEYISIDGRVPSKGGYYADFKITAKAATQLIESKRKYEKAKETYDNLLQETTSALLALKTHAKIKENLPEAAPFLPPPLSNALVVNFTSLQKKLNKQPEIGLVSEK